MRTRFATAIGWLRRRVACGVALAVAGLTLTSCIADTDTDLCAGDDPLPECVDGVLPDPLRPTALGDADANGGDGTGAASGDTAGCNPDNEPTWNTTAGSIIRSRCASCHRSECSTYVGLSSWLHSGLLRQYVSQGHYISGSNRSTVLHWIDIGAPETVCDVK